MLISIRPEAFHPYHAGVPTNRITGKIEGRTYLGSNAQYSIRAEGDQLWDVMELNPTEMRPIGQSIIFSVNPDDVVILKP